MRDVMHEFAAIARREKIEYTVLNDGCLLAYGVRISLGKGQNCPIKFDGKSFTFDDHLAPSLSEAIRYAHDRMSSEMKRFQCRDAT